MAEYRAMGRVKKESEERDGVMEREGEERVVDSIGEEGGARRI